MTEGADVASARPSIVDLLRQGQEIVVQVRKDALSGKGARVSAHVTLPSRYLVLLPGSSISASRGGSRTRPSATGCAPSWPSRSRRAPG